MASIALDRVWLHQAADLSTYLKFFTTASGDERSMAGDVRRMSNGRLRLVTSVGLNRTHPTTLRMVSDDDLATLEDWIGDLLLFRDHRGRLMFCTYFTFSVTDYKDRSGYDVTLSLSEVSSSIEV